MTLRIAINGFGRIGEMVFRSILQDPVGIEVVAINDLADLAQLSYVLRYDSVHRSQPPSLESGPGWLKVDGRETQVFQERDPALLPWGDLGVDVVVEATGVFESREGMNKHLAAGARRVVLTAPAKADGADITLCMGVNHQAYRPAEHRLISNASCTTNCLAPLVRALDEAFGLRWGLMSTVHAYTGSQALVDRADKDLRRGRAAALNIVPTSTGAARAIGLVLPQLKGRIDGLAYRVPVPDGSVVDLTFQSEKPIDAQAIHQTMRAAAADPSYLGVLGYTEDPIVSSDIVGLPWSCLFDATSTVVADAHTAKVLAWYDNEFGYARRVHDLLRLIARDA